MSLFFVDSGSELDADLTKKMGIERINLPFALEGEHLHFTNKFDFNKFYSKLSKGMKLDSLDLSMEEYNEIFEPCLSQGDDIVYIHSSANIVNIDTLQRVRESLLEKYPDRRFELIDSKNISIGQGLVSYESAMLYRKGESIDEILDKSHAIASQYATFFVVDSTQTMVENNIVSSESISGTALNIKSLFAVDIDGKIQLYDRISGKKRAVSKLLEICRQLGNNVADYPIGIAYSSDETIATDLADKLRETFGNDINLIKERISPSNASLLGRGVLAISFHVHHKIH